MKSPLLQSLSAWILPLALLASAASTGFTAPKSFVLVQEGQAKATIVTAANPSENAAAASREMQLYVRKMSGAELPIVGDDQQASGPLILVGPSQLTEKEA